MGNVKPVKMGKTKVYVARSAAELYDIIGIEPKRAAEFGALRCGNINLCTNYEICKTMSYFFSKFAGQGYFVDASPIISVGYVVHAWSWTRCGQADKKRAGEWDTGQLGHVGRRFVRTVAAPYLNREPKVGATDYCS